MPVYNQETQYVLEKEPADMGDYIFIDLEVRNIDNTNSINNEEERIQEELNTIKILKKQELSDSCNNEIMAGFISTIKFNEPKLYEMQLENQLNMMGRMNDLVLNEKMGLPAPITIQYYPKGESCSDYTITEFMQLCKEATNFKIERINKYKALSQQIDAATTIEEVNSIIW